MLLLNKIYNASYVYDVFFLQHNHLTKGFKKPVDFYFFYTIYLLSSNITFTLTSNTGKI